MAKVEFMFDGQKIDVFCNDTDKFAKIIQKFCTKVQRDSDNLCFLYNGQIVNINLTFLNLANSIDKKRKVISLIVFEQYAKNDSKFIKENKELKDKLFQAYKKIDEQKEEIEELKYKMTIIKSESMNQINNLMKTIEDKEKQIKELKANSKNKKKSNNHVDLSKIKTVHFLSHDSLINHAIACRGDESFSQIEAKLYEIYPELKETNNNFICRGSLVARFKTIDENNIKDGDKVILIRLE